MSEFTFRILNGLKWWAAVFTVFFVLVVLTAPSLFGMLFIRSSTVGFVFLVALVGFVVGFRRIKY